MYNSDINDIDEHVNNCVILEYDDDIRIYERIGVSSMSYQIKYTCTSVTILHVHTEKALLSSET